MIPTNVEELRDMHNPRMREKVYREGGYDEETIASLVAIDEAIYSMPDEKLQEYLDDYTSASRSQ